MTQPTENDDEIFILVLDETYDQEEQASDETWKENSEKQRLRLEEEFGVGFERANVGAGADIPAFLTVLDTLSIEVPLWAAIAAAFFAGKPIRDNSDAWREIGKMIRRFFSRPVILSRHGAAVIAVEAVMDEIGGLPKSIKLLSYRPYDSRLEQRLACAEQSEEIRPAPETLYLGDTLHIFEIEADGVKFRVGVRGKNTEVVRIE